MAKNNIKTCRYANCKHPDKKIDITVDDYKLVGKTMYYHSDCLNEKQSGGWKDEQTKADLQYIKNQWTLHIDRTVVYWKLFKVLNELLSRGISSDYLVFVLDYVISHKMKLNYPNGFRYYVDKQYIKDAYQKSKIKRTPTSAFFTEEPKYSEPEEVKPHIVARKPKGFESILKSKK